ncbi:DUF3592 domain-containing protein [uncultured Aquimarina sp.]|uniref:DUF3592 domain-containing protein n=1 Tax=uncultured Aquimarina sp. TaxID=575652 RepID=UPI00262C1599|nr:DUF3592 domain-containing protein [uncultured Aquimarina sp.]
MTIIILSTIGILFFGIGIYLKKDVRNFKKNGTKTNAEIISYVKEISEFKNEKTTYYYPRFRFKNTDGKLIEKTHSSGLTNRPTKPIPERKEIYYLKNENEYEILINSKLWTSIIPNAVMIFGLLFLISIITVIILRDILNYIQ